MASGAACATALAVVLAGVAIAADARVPDYEIVSADDTAATRRIVQDLDQRLAPLFARASAQRPGPLCVAIGPLALRAALQRKEGCALIAAYTSSPVVRTLLAAVPAARALPFTAVYAEPAPADQLHLISMLYRRPVRIAAIVGADSGFLRPALSAEADVQELAPGDDINRVLNRIAQAEVLLATPDNSVYNTENFRNILLSTYRHSQAVIGFSADMVKAGALASVYSGIEDINTQLAEIAAGYLADGALPPPQFPRYFSAIVNEGVARSLNVPVDAAARQFSRRPARRMP